MRQGRRRDHVPARARALSYVEAIERLAGEARVQLRYEGDSAAERRAAERRNALYRANEEASALYRRMLEEGSEAEDARAYVDRARAHARGDRDFQIGYAPGYQDFLLRRLAGQRDLSPEILLEAGVASGGTTASCATGSADV